MNEKVMTLYESAENVGLLPVLGSFGKNLHINIPFSLRFGAKSIDELDLSVRSSNGLKRAGAQTIEEAIKIIMSKNGLESIRNLGKKSISEIKTTLLCEGYKNLNKPEKLDFWNKFIENNSNNFN